MRGVLIIICLLAGILNIKAQIVTAGDYINLQLQDFSLIGTNNAPVNMNLNSLGIGKGIGAATNSELFLHLTSIVPGNTHREVTARISVGTVPSGTKLSLQSSPCTTLNSGGKLGIPVGTAITLNAIDQIIIDEIGSCYTGTAYNDGYQMNFKWEPELNAQNYHLLMAKPNPESLTIVFTITEHNAN